MIEKKAALVVDFCSKKIAESLQTGLNYKEVEADLRALGRETGGWLSAHKVAGREYFKLGPGDINIVCARLANKLQRELEQ